MPLGIALGTYPRLGEVREEREGHHSFCTVPLIFECGVCHIAKLSDAISV